jgi:hypothetical protein
MTCSGIAGCGFPTGTPIPVHHRSAPRVSWAEVPYLDPAIGDHKIIWELNRHQYWLQLARAAWLTRDQRYARENRRPDSTTGSTTIHR